MTHVHVAGRYNGMSIWLHWLTFALFVAAYATIELREFFPKGTNARETMKWLHGSIGLAIFAVAGIRLALRAILSRPQDSAGWMRVAARATHAALYTLMIALPLTGWLMLSAEGNPVRFFGLHLPPLLAANEPLADKLEELHETLGTIGYGLIAIHAAAALFHHYALRDGLLSRMAPFRS